MITGIIVSLLDRNQEVLLKCAQVLLWLLVVCCPALAEDTNAFKYCAIDKNKIAAYGAGTLKCADINFDDKIVGDLAMSYFFGYVTATNSEFSYDALKYSDSNIRQKLAEYCKSVPDWSFYKAIDAYIAGLSMKCMAPN